MTFARTTYSSHEEWVAEAKRRFGENSNEWKFVCPACKYVATVREWKEAGATQGEIAFSCVGRRKAERAQAFGGDRDKQGGPCDYAGGGLFRLNPVTVHLEDGKSCDVFDFAD